MNELCKDCKLKPRLHYTKRGSYCRECKNKRQREGNRKVFWFRYYLKTRYDLSLEEHQVLLDSCDNKCQICKEETPLQIDHCHKTGKVRGMLCGPCNRGLGYLEKPGFLEAAKRYINDTPYQPP